MKSIIKRDANAVLQAIFRMPRLNTLRAGAGGEVMGRNIKKMNLRLS